MENQQPEQIGLGPQTTSKSEGERRGFFWRRYWRLVAIATVSIAVLIGALIAFLLGVFSGEHQPSETPVRSYTNYEVQSIDLNGFSLSDFGLSTSQSLSVNGQLFVNNSLVLAPIGQPASAQTGQLYYDETSNGITYFNGTEYLTLANTGQVGALRAELQSVGARISSMPAAASIPSDLATLGADNLFQGANTFTGGLSANTLRVNGVTVLGATSISSLLLTTPLGVASGGTGSSSLASNGVLIGQGADSVVSVTAAESGLCLMSTGGTPTFATCSGVSSLNGLSGGITLSNATASGTTLTMDDASTTNKGIARFNSINFTVAAGVVDTVQNIGTTATPTFNGINVSSVTAANDLTISAGTNGNLALATSGIGALYLSGYNCSAAGGGGKLTVDAGGRVVCGADNDTPTPGDGEGITSVGVVDSQPKSASGAVIVGSTIYLQTADASSLGLVSTGTQTFAGAKTFLSQASFSAGANISGSLTVSDAINTAIITGGSLSATTVNGLAVSSNALTATGALTVSTATNNNLTLATSGSGSLYLSGYNCSALDGGGKLTVDASGRVNCAADTDTDTDTDTGITTIVAGNGIQVVSNNQVSVQLRSGYGLAFDAVNPNGVGLTSCATNQVLKSNGSGWDCANDNDTATPGDGQGITGIGALDGGTASANGASLSADGSTIFLQSASPLRNGLVTTGAQDFAGSKTFSDSVTAAGGVVIASGQNITLGTACGAGQVLSTDATGVVTCVADNEGTDTDTGVTTVGQIDTQPKSSNGAVINGTAIYLQTADASSIGLVSTSAQSMSGEKTFNDAGRFLSGLTVTGNLGVSGTLNGAVLSGGSLSATTVNGLAVSTAAIASSAALTVSSANNQNLTLATSGSGALYLSGYNCSALDGGGKLTVDASGRVNCAADTDTDTDTGITTIVAGNGIQVVSDNQVSVQLRAGYGLAFDAINPNGVGLTSCATNQVLKSNGSGWDCANDSDTPTPGDGQGITNIGALDGGTAGVNGASLSGDGSTIYLQSASPLRNGLVTTSAQTFAGLKTFANGLAANGLISANAGITIASGQNITLGTVCATGQILSTDASGAIVCIVDNQGTDTDTGVTAIGALDSQVKQANGAVISGRTIYLQTANASSAGLMGIGTQSFAGAKTFNGVANFAAGVNITGTLSVSSTINGATLTGGSLSGAAVNGLSVSSSTIAAPAALTVSSANNQNLTLATSGSGSLYLSGYNCSALDGGGKLTVDASGRVSCAADIDTDTDTDTGITTIVAGSGIQVVSNNQVSVQLRSGYGLAFDAVSPNGVGLTSCATNQVLKSNGSGWDCANDNDTATPGDGQGITGIGALDGGTANANGASIGGSGTVLYLQSANALRNGLVTTGAQTFAGAKSFNGLIAANGSLAIASGQTVTLGTACSAGQVLGTNGSGVIMCVADGTGVDTGVTAVGVLDGQTRSANGATIVGNSIYLQTADALNAGLISTGAQTFTGSKTFNNSVTTSGAFVSTVATGTAPLTVSSTTKVTNLNADLLDGLDSSAFATNSALAGYVQLQGATPGTPQTGNINITGTAIAAAFSGSGAGLTNLNATTLTAGTVNSARIAGSYSGLTGTGTLSVGSISAGFGTISTANTIQGTRLISTIATGTAPLTVSSTTKVTSLNVDLLDGLDSTYFTDVSARLGYIPSKSATSTNSIVALDSRASNFNPQDRDAGLYADFAANTADGLNDGGMYHGVLTFRAYGAGADLSGGFPLQMANSANGNLWTRVGTSATTWGGWSKLWSDANDGAGSGLNADTLDGLDSSAFAAASSLAGYVQLQGATPGTPQTGHVNITGTAIAASFSGSGANLTGLNATQLTSGTVNTARIAGSYGGVTGTGALTVGSIASGFGTISTANTITGTTLNGTTGINTGAGAGTSRITAAGLLQNVTGDAAILTSGTLNTARLTGAYTGVTGVGTVTTGTWQGSTVVVQHGGTGATSFTANGIVYGNGSGALQATAAGATGQCLVATTSGAPTWGTCGNTSLQTAYVNSAGGTTPEIKLDATRGGLDIQDADASINSNLLTVRASNAAGLGSALLSVSSKGDVAFTGDLVRVESSATQTDATEYTTASENFITVKSFTFAVTSDRTLRGVYWKGDLRDSSVANDRDAKVQLVCGQAGNRVVLGSAITSLASSSYASFSIATTNVPLSCAGYNGDVVIDVQLAVTNNSATAYVDEQQMTVRYAALGTYQKAATQTDSTEYTTTSSFFTTVKSFTFPVTGDRTLRSVYWKGSMHKQSSAGTTTKVQLVCGQAGSRTVVGTAETQSNTYLAFSITNTNIPLGCVGYNGNITIDVQLTNVNGSGWTAYVDEQQMTVVYDEGAVSVVSGGHGSGSSSASPSTTASGTPFTDPQHPDGLASQAINRSVNSWNCYQVPAGKTFYLTSIYGSSAGATTLFNSTGCENSGTVLRPAVPQSETVSLASPIPVPGGSYITTSSQNNSLSITGYEITSGVTAINRKVDSWNCYQVPAGKTFYLVGASGANGVALYNSSGCENSGTPLVSMTVDGHRNFGTPIPIPSGSYITTASQNYSLSIVGYITTADGTGGADIAENYFVLGGAEPGDIVSIDAMSAGDAPAVSRSTARFDSKLIAVISTKPGMVLSDETTTGKEGVMAIALNGRVPVKVNDEGGCIAVGDPVTSSSVAGVGMKANGAGRIVGYALSAYCGGEQGTVTVFINPGTQTSAPNNVQGSQAMLSTLNVSGETTLASVIVEGDATINGSLVVHESVTTSRIIINGHIIAGGAKPAVVAMPAAGDSNNSSVQVSVAGNDTTGSLTVVTGSAGTGAGVLARLTFTDDFEGQTFNVVLTASNSAAGLVRYHVVKTADGFEVVANDPVQVNTTYIFDYVVLGAKPNN